jgi:ABC-type antimicrobial peptide transport system permease subunit
MQDVMGASVAQQRFSMLLFSVFGLILLALGAAGLYGVMSYRVTRQTKEIGIRMALGAQPGNIVRMVLREATLLVAYGLAAGIVASVAGAQLLRSLLFGVAPRDPITLTFAGGVLYWLRPACCLVAATPRRLYITNGGVANRVTARPGKTGSWVG